MVLTVPAGWLGGNNLRYQEMRFFVESSSRNWPAADNKADLKKYCLGSELFNLTQSTTNLPISEDNRDLNLAWNMNAYVRDQSKPQGLLLVHYQNGQTRGEVLQMEQPLATLTWDDLKRFSGEPGAVVEIPLDFMQNAVLQANFTFSVSGIPAGWSASVSPANARASQHSSIPLTLTVRIPATAPLGSIAALRVEAKSAEHPSLAPSAAVPVKVVRKGFFPFLAGEREFLEKEANRG